MTAPRHRGKFPIVQRLINRRLRGAARRVLRYGRFAMLFIPHRNSRSQSDPAWRLVVGSSRKHPSSGCPGG